VSFEIIRAPSTPRACFVCNIDSLHSALNCSVLILFLVDKESVAGPIKFETLLLFSEGLSSRSPRKFQEI
jgi:hypothetical protein